jgi:sulfur dioxygenase
MNVGLDQEEIQAHGWAVTVFEALALIGKPGVAMIDLRESSERERHALSGIAAYTLYCLAREYCCGQAS